MKLFDRQQMLGVIAGSALCAYVLNNDYLSMLISTIMGVVLAHVLKAFVQLLRAKKSSGGE